MPQAVGLAIAGQAITAAAWVEVALTVASIAYGHEEKRKQERRAREAHNASLKDRELVVRSAVTPARTIYGRDRVGGSLAFLHKEAPDPKVQFLYVVVTHANHECDGYEALYLNETRLPEPDAEGFIASGPFAKRTLETNTVIAIADENGNIVLPHNTFAQPVIIRMDGTGQAGDSGSGPSGDAGSPGDNGAAGPGT